MMLRMLFFIVGLILFADGFFLIAQKKIHLGTIIPLILGAILSLYALCSSRLNEFLKRHSILNKVWRITYLGFSAWLLSLLTFFAYLYTHIKDASVQPDTQAIIILGSGIIQGKASPTLALRLDRGAEIALQMPQAWIVVTGGHDFGEVKTEAEVMSEYLQSQHHIPTQRILLEDQSTSTELNLKNSLVVLKQHDLGLESKIAIVTSDFHTLRAEAITHKQGYQNVTLYSASTPLMTRYNAWLREYFAYLSGWLLNEY